MIAQLISWFQIFWSSIFIDFHRFSSIFAKFDENIARELDFFDQNPKTISTNVLVPSCISAAPPRFVWQNFAKRFHFCCSWLAKLWFLRKIDENRRKSMKIDEIRWNSMEIVTEMIQAGIAGEIDDVAVTATLRLYLEGSCWFAGMIISNH